MTLMKPPLEEPINRDLAKQLMARKYDYRDILCEIGDKEPCVVPGKPTSFKNPVRLKVAPRQQGNRGTCVGQAKAQYLDAIHVTLTGQEPQGTIQRDLKEGIAVYDILYDVSYSAQCAYEYSRIEGNVTVPSGSYCNAAIKSMLKRGCCLETQWRTSKESRAVWATPYPASAEECQAEAITHVIEGYASLRSVEAITDAIWKHGSCMGAINIFENYMDGGKNSQGLIIGDLQDPRGQCVGSHALWFWGYDDQERRLYFNHSWEGWTVEGSISYAYWEDAGGDFWVAMDTKETLIGQNLTKKVNFTANEACKVYIDDVWVGVAPISAYVTKGKHTLKATATGYVDFVKEIVVDDGMTDYTIMLEAEPKKNPLAAFVTWIIEVMRALIDSLRRK